MTHLHSKYATFIFASDLSNLKDLSVATLAQNLAEFKVPWTSLLLSRIDILLAQLNPLYILRPSIQIATSEYSNKESS